MSDTKLTIHQALSLVMGDVREVKKGEVNRGLGFAFRGIDAVVNAVAPALRKHGVVVLPEVLDVAYRDVKTSTGKPSRECTVRVRYTFYGPDGSSLAATTAGESLDSGDKGTAKAMSVAFRIALLQALALPTDDRDPDADSYERSESSALPSELYFDLSKRVDAASDKEVKRGLWSQVSLSAREGALSPEEAQDLQNRLQGEPTTTVQRRTA